MTSGKIVIERRAGHRADGLVTPPITHHTRICSMRGKPKSPGAMKKDVCA